MSTTPTPPAATGSPWWRGWADFWFRPADPTTLGFIRIATGLLVLYVYLTYSLDLQAFFGEHGWYAKRFVDKERREVPAFVSPTDWDTPYVVTARLSDFPHRRQAFMEFLRNVPGNKSERVVSLAYLNRANDLPNPDEFRRAMAYVQSIKTRDALNSTVTVIKDGVVQDKVAARRYEEETPEFIKRLPDPDRARVAAEIENFWALLPRELGSPARDYVLQHLVELPPEGRRELVRYVNELPEEKPQRDEQLTYLEYWNVDRAKAYRTGTNNFSVWFHVTDPTQMAIIHGGVILLIVMFTAGLFTRVTSVLVWVATVGYIHRTQQVLFGMDTMSNLLLFYLMIGNSGAALSLDRLIARYRATRASLRRTGTIDPMTRAFLACPPPSASAGFALRLIQIHVCFIYAAAGLSKLKGASWWSGQAFWDVAVNPEFTPLHYTWYEASLRWMVQSKWVYHIMCTFGVWFTLFIEVSLPFLVWTRLRWIILLLATAMHAAIGVMMGLNLFELLMIVMFLAFLPDRVIRDRFRGGPELPKFTFRFNPAVPTHTRAAALALALDVDNQVTLAPDKAAAETAVAGKEGGPVSGSEGMRTLSKGLRFLSAFGWVLWIPGVKALLAHRLFPGSGKPPAPSVSVKPPTPAVR